MFRSELATLYTFEAYDSDGNGRVVFDGYMPSSFAISGAHTAREAVAQLGLSDYALFDNSISHAEAAYMTREAGGKTYYISTHYIKTDPAAFYFDEIYVKNLSLNYVEYRETFVSEWSYVYLTDTKINQHFSANSPILLTALLNNSFIRQEGSSYLNPVGYGNPLTSYGEPEISQWKNQFYYRYIGSDVTDEFTPLLPATAQAIGPDAQFYANVVADLGGGNDSFTGSDRADIVYGGAGDDYIMAFYNPSLSNFERPLVPFDTLDGDYLDGGDGDDSIIGVSGGTMIGGAGYDFLHFSTHSEIERRIELKLSGVSDIGYQTVIGGFEQFQMVIEDNSGLGTELDARGLSSFRVERPQEYSYFNLVGDRDSLIIDENTNGYFLITGVEKIYFDFSKSSVGINLDFKYGNNSSFSPTTMNNLTLQQPSGFKNGFDTYGSIYNDSLSSYITGESNIYGGEGNDRYYVFREGINVIERQDEGSDTIISEIDYTLGANFENLTLVDHPVTPLRSPSKALGNKLDNVLVGNNVGNLLDGDRGADVMRGGNGDDRYIVDNIRDVVKESPSIDHDSVSSYISYALPKNVENVFLQGKKNINAQGNNDENSIHGNSGKNNIDGKLGFDFLTGGNGRDIFVFSTFISERNVDTIVDFSHKDKIQLNRSVFSNLTNGKNLTAGEFKASDQGKLDPNDRILFDKYSGEISYDPDGSGAKKAVVFAEVSFVFISSLSYNDFFIM